MEDGRFGLGLGLLLVRQTAALHGGALLISEAPEGGTIAALSFRRNLPASGAFRSPWQTWITPDAGTTAW